MRRCSQWFANSRYLATRSLILVSGILSSSELLHSLAEDRVLPLFFKKQLSSGARQYSILAFACFCAVVYAVSGASLNIVSKM
jgi:amino acid permease